MMQTIEKSTALYQATFLQALETWCKERMKSPSQVDVKLANILRPGNSIRVAIRTHASMDDVRPVQRSHVLMFEMLTEETVERLTTALQTLRDHQGIAFRQGLSYMTFFYLAFFDVERAQQGKRSILVTTQQESSEDDEREDLTHTHVRLASWSLEKVLQFWETFGRRLAQGFPALEDSVEGRWSYQTIPPIWIPEGVSEAEGVKAFFGAWRQGREGWIGHDVPSEEVPIMVPVTLKTWMENLVSLLREPAPEGVQVNVTFDAASERQIEHIGAPQAVSGQNKFADVFTHSDDFRIVCLRGQNFPLTSKQADAVEFLFNLHQSGISEAHLQRITRAAECSERLRDLFRSSPDAWGTLIVKGTRSGFYRLNIFD